MSAPAIAQANVQHSRTTVAPSLQQAVRRGAQKAPAKTAGWTWATFSGRLTEFSAGRSSSALSLSTALVREAQQLGEPVAWVARPGGSFFPPDAATCGVDLRALPVIQVHRSIETFKAADHLLRCGSFGLVVLDLPSQVRMPIATQTRLASLAHRHNTAVVCLTEKEIAQSSLGSLVSLRAQIDRKSEWDGKRFRCRAKVIKDKQNGPGWQHLESFRGSPGLC